MLYVVHDRRFNRMAIAGMIVILLWLGAGRGSAAELTRCNGFNDAKVAWEAVAAGAEEPMALRSLTPPVLLPDGSRFKTWEPAEPAGPRRTFFVAQQHPQAADDNLGTEERPWKTIGRAARTLEPGDRVVVKEGLYREWVRPACGGLGPKLMVTYQAAPGEKVILSGSDPLVGRWAASRPAGHTPVAKAMMIELPEALFHGYNPFAENNISQNMTTGLPGMAKRLGWLKPPYTLPRGLVFQDGQRLAQVVEYEELAKAEGAYWVEPGARRIHLRTSGDKDPAKAVFEVTTRPFAFAPEKAGLGFIRVDGFTVERVANCYPVPQLGAISTMQGHHWIVENNVVRQVNGLGLDFGRRQTFLPYQVPPDTPTLAGVGHIVRRNAFIECGVCSLSGLGVIGGLVEDNYTQGCGWHRVGGLCEAGGIKLHYLKHALVRRNVILGTVNAHGLWVDHSLHNARVTRNIVIGSQSSGIYLEATYGPTLIDHNIVWDCEGPGILLSHSGNATITNNLFGRSSGPPVLIGTARPGPKGRKLDLETGRMSASEHNRVVGNVFYGFADRGPNVPKDMENVVDYNVFANPPEEKPFNLVQWQRKTGCETHSQSVTAKLEFAASTWVLRGTIPLLTFPRVDTVTCDYFGTARGKITNAGPVVKENVKSETVLWPGLRQPEN